MKRISTRWARPIATLAVASLLAGCALPRSGPSKNEIFAGSVQRMGNAFIIDVDDRVTRLASVTPTFGFGSAFLNAATLGSDVISPGDTLGLTIYENVDDGLLTQLGSSAAVLDEIQVDGNGFIFVPYAGRIRAAGNSPEAVRRIITEKLEAQTPDPQVIVRRLSGDGSTVSVVGAVGGQGVYAIDRPTRTLTAMLARAGGVAIPTESARVTVIRGQHTGTIWLEDLYRNAHYDIALRPGDRVFVEEDERFFTALGATGAQQKVPFATRDISAIEAMAQVGGLNPNLADPTGIFIFREETEAVAEALLARTDLVGPQRVVYVLNLTEPNGIFQARDFIIRAEDTVYVTTAPYAQFTKTLTTIVAPLAPAAQVNALVN